MCRAAKVSILGVASVAVLGAWKAFPAPSIQGVWRTASVTISGPAGRTIPQFQPNLAIITAKHYSRVEVHVEGSRPSLADPASATAEELRRVWGPVVAEAGKYDLAVGTMTTRPEIAKNPTGMGNGAFTEYGYRIAGDSLWLTTRRNERGPVVNPPTIKLVRIE
jgi:hypothetical protein